jgi:hypothetical protein
MAARYPSVVIGDKPKTRLADAPGVQWPRAQAPAPTRNLQMPSVAMIMPNAVSRTERAVYGLLGCLVFHVLLGRPPTYFLRQASFGPESTPRPCSLDWMLVSSAGTSSRCPLHLVLVPPGVDSCIPCACVFRPVFREESNGAIMAPSQRCLRRLQMHQ